MKNELIESRLRRDDTTNQFLTRAKPRYADIEDDVAPLRAQLAQGLADAAPLTQEVLSADEDNNAARKRGERSQLTTLLLRQNRALRAHAKGRKPTPDTELLGRLPKRPSELREIGDSTFLEEAKRLLDLGATVAATDLAKRRFTAQHRTDANKLLLGLTTTRQTGTTSDIAGATGRRALERIIKASARTIAELEEFFAPYNDPDDKDARKLYDEWRTATKVIRRGGHDGPLDKPASAPTK